MKKLCVDISEKSSKFLLWEDDDIETIKMFELSQGIGVDDYAAELEEFIYEHPGIIRSNADTQILLATQYAALVPTDIKNEAIEKLMRAAWGTEDENEREIEISAIKGQEEIKCAVSLDKSTGRFMKRSFHPLRISWILEPFITKWQSVEAPDAGFSMFVEGEGRIFYIGIFNGKKLKYANVMTIPEGNTDFYLRGIKQMVAGENVMSLYIDPSQSIAAELEDWANQEKIAIKYMDNKFRSSFMTYIYDSPDISLPIKTFIRQQNV